MMCSPRPIAKLDGWHTRIAITNDILVAAAVVVGAFTRKFASAELAGHLQWREGSTLTRPESLPVILRR
jgi:hypothetical protein